MKKRSPVAIVLLSLVTFGIYAYYWLYATGEELKRESGRRDITPALDAFLAFLTVGVWGIWAGYRNARIAHELLEERGEAHSDHALPVAAAGVASYFLGPWTWLVAMVLVQEDLNELAEPFDYFTDKRPRARVVDVEPVVEQPIPARRSDSDAEVWESNAPAPIVY
jgi:hypothetical protein